MKTEYTERCVTVIIAEDGTWHRPLTYELAALQGFPSHLPDGRPFQLEFSFNDVWVMPQDDSHPVLVH